MTARCYVCDEPAAPDADPRNALCETCSPVRDHIISNQRIGRRMVAYCRCGWKYEEPVQAGSDRAAAWDERGRAVNEHWRAVIEEASR